MLLNWSSLVQGLKQLNGNYPAVYPPAGQTLNHGRLYYSTDGVDRDCALAFDSPPAVTQGTGYVGAALLSFPMKPVPPQTFSQLLRADNHFTDRDFMKALGMGHPKLKRREADPSLFTVGELVLLANLIGHSIQEVMRVVLTQVEHDPQIAEKSKEAQQQVVGRKYYPRKPKALERE